MMSKLGEPDLKISRLNIWIHGRQFPASQDYLDSEWLNVTAEYAGRDSRVVAHGTFIRLNELSRFSDGLVSLDKDLKGSAAFECIEPNLHVEIHAKNLGHLEMKTRITADHMTESHEFREQIDQTFLAPLISGLRAVLTRYPMRDPAMGTH